MRLIGLLLGLVLCSGGIRANSLIDIINSKTLPPAPVDYQRFHAQGESTVSRLKLNVPEALYITLSPINGQSAVTLTQTSDSYAFEKRTRPTAFTEKRKQLPNISFAVDTYQSIAQVRNKQLQRTDHPHWDFFIGDGEVLIAGTKPLLALPLTLVEKNQNCTHNGVVYVPLSGKPAYYQITAETCAYYKVNLWGRMQATVERAKKTKQVGDDVGHENLVSVKPINELVAAHKLDKAALAQADLIARADMTQYGVVHDGVAYVSECQTRSGPLPFCDRQVLPSYSLAKSLFGAVIMMHLQQVYKDVFSQNVSDWVPACDAPHWHDVTFADLLNMTTGHYEHIRHGEDEGADHSQVFFAASTHTEKINYSCNQFPRRSAPGQQFVYHSSDTYLLGSALQAYLSAKLARPANVFDDVLAPIFKGLGLSDVALSSRFTLDQQRQPFVGYGLFLLRDDLVRLMMFLFEQTRSATPMLDRATLTSALQLNPEAAGVPTEFATVRYSNGVWAYNAASPLNCSNPTWVPYMMGYGGLIAVLVSDRLQYFYFSDSHHYLWQPVLTELNKLDSICLTGE